MLFVLSIAIEKFVEKLAHLMSMLLVSGTNYLFAGLYLSSAARLENALLEFSPRVAYLWIERCR